MFLFFGFLAIARKKSQNHWIFKIFLQGSPALSAQIGGRTKSSSKKNAATQKSMPGGPLDF